MRRATWVLCLLAASPAAFHGQGSGPVPPLSATAPAAGNQIRKGTGFILGRALDIGTGQPIAGALVSLTGYGEVPSGSLGGAVPSAPMGPVGPLGSASSTGPASRSVITNSSGDFFFRELSGGRYAIAVSAMGYLNGGYRIRPNGNLQFLDLGENEKRGDVVVRLSKYAALGGTVLDEAGEPAVGAAVRILQRSITAGRVRLLSLATPTLTDDRGVYRAGGLTPGDYVVGIITTQSTIPATLAAAYADAAAQTGDPNRAPPMRGDLMNNGVSQPSGTGARVGDLILQMSGTSLLGYTPPQPSDDGRLLSYTTTFFPNAATPPEATVITLGSGEERTGVDLSIRLVPTVRVSGVLTGPDGPAKNMGVMLMAPGSDQFANGGMPTATAATDATGAFTLLGVPAGSYMLKASRSMVVRLTTPTPADRMLWAAQPVVVESRDITDLRVELKPAMTVSGRVEFVGAQPRPEGQQLQRFNIMLIAVETGISQRSSAAIVTADGGFVTNGDLPGKYFVHALAPPPWTLRSVQQGSRNVTDDPIELTTEVSGLVATFIDSSSKLSGTVVDAKGAPDTQADVIVFPSDSDGWRRGEASPGARRLRSVSTTRAGTYAFAALLAGAYYVVAVDNGATAQYTDPKFLEKLIAGATRVTIAEGDDKTVALKTFAVR